MSALIDETDSNVEPNLCQVCCALTSVGVARVRVSDVDKALGAGLESHVVPGHWDFTVIAHWPLCSRGLLVPRLLLSVSD